MGRTIYEKVIAKKDEMSDKKNGQFVAGQNSAMAVAAINGGIRSAAWKAYMMQFVDQDPPGTPINPAQLSRLLATDGTLGHPVFDRMRAYLVGDAVCGMGTAATFGETVNGIDNTVPGS